jgi:hypothetical protein
MTLSNRFGDSQRQYGVVPVVVLDIGGLLSGTHPSTATGLGMRSPTMLSDIDAFIADIETITNSAAIQDQYWRASPSTTERGTSNVGATSVAEEVRKHRDDISRRTRLTRQQIARALGVDRRSLSFWVSGSSGKRADGTASCVSGFGQRNRHCKTGSGNRNPSRPSRWSRRTGHDCSGSVRSRSKLEKPRINAISPDQSSWPRRSEISSICIGIRSCPYRNAPRSEARSNGSLCSRVRAGSFARGDRISR